MRKKGFTLIELLAALAIASILIATSYAIFGANLKIAKHTYKNELEYKEASVGFNYIDNIIRSSYKIELIEDNGETNLKAYVLNKESKDISSYTFFTDTSNKKRYLYAYIDNTTNKSQRGAKLRIASCQDLYLYFDPSKQIVKLIMNKDNLDIRYETSINIGKRL
mgnify:CR=1 FL=1